MYRIYTKVNAADTSRDPKIIMVETKGSLAALCLPLVYHMLLMTWTMVTTQYIRNS